MEQARPSSGRAARASVDGQIINLRSLEESVARSMERSRRGAGFTLFTLNLDHLVRLRGDAAFRAAYARATFVTADGAPVAKLARRRDSAIERVTGADLVAPLCAAAAREGMPVHLFGASEATLKKAEAALRRLHPGLLLAGMEAPPYGFDPAGAEADAAGDRIARSGAKLCFVALGAPKQEFFADRMLNRHPDIGWLGVGAALDFLAEEKSRAPRLLQRLGLEWTWRLAQEPRRLGLRYCRCALLFARLLWRERQATAPDAKSA